MHLQIVNADPKYTLVKLVEPTALGYIHIAAEMHPRAVPLLPNPRAKSMLLAELKALAHRLQQFDAAVRVSVFDSTGYSPLSPDLQQRADAIHIARFDIVVLIETTSPATARELQTTAVYQTLLETVRHEATSVHVIAARTAKQIGDVDKARSGAFRFTYFVADDADVMLQLWDYLAGWYAVETGLANASLLVPLHGERSDYVGIEYAGLGGRSLVRQMRTKSFRTYLQANLAANRVGAMPVLYQRAWWSGA
jgi:hypothetical protein